MSAIIGDQHEHGALLDRLDELWTRHLEQLDQYQKARNDLGKLIASGHFSLTQANFKSPNRRPYGRDYYDQRTKATRRCVVHNGTSIDDPTHFAVLDSRSLPREEGDGGEEKSPEPTQQPSPPSTPIPDTAIGETSGTEASSTEQDEKAAPAAGQTALSLDPIKWFGILVPRKLRSARASFAAAVDGPLVNAVNAARAMREIEAEIRRVRKAVTKSERAGARSSD
ncbi:hypothetical protein LTR53_014086 [Teratosphaeriaceae sp. CCFEE 6253]|nr:hypothetical protein LTR53_014086 [Teratosphaeriaceae sp. CCFEE 6253]